MQLAEAWCTEGCCGALYVTVVRDHTVPWHNWRRPPAPKSEPPLRELPDLRLNVTRYNAEITGAENDQSWEWAARALARLIREIAPTARSVGSAELPAGLDRHTPRPTRPGRAELHLSGAATLRLDSSPWVQFIWSIPDNVTPMSALQQTPSTAHNGPP